MGSTLSISRSANRKSKALTLLAFVSFLMLAALVWLPFRLTDTPEIMSQGAAPMEVIDSWMNEELTIPAEMLEPKETDPQDYLDSRTLLIDIAYEYSLPSRFPDFTSNTSETVARLSEPIPFNSGELAAISSVSAELKPLVLAAGELSRLDEYCMNLRTEFGTAADQGVYHVLYKVNAYMKAQIFLQEWEEAGQASIVYLKLLHHDPEQSIPWYEVQNFLDAISIFEAMTTQTQVRREVGQALVDNRSFALHFHNSLDFPGESEVNHLQNLAGRGVVKELPRTRLELQRMLEFINNHFPEYRTIKYRNLDLTQEQGIGDQLSVLVSTPIRGLRSSGRAYESLKGHFFRRMESQLREKTIARNYDQLCDQLSK